MAERLKAQLSKSCVPETVPRVRIPLSPQQLDERLYLCYGFRKGGHLKAQTGKVKFLDLGHGDCVAMGDRSDAVRCVIEVVSPTENEHILIVHGLGTDPDLPFDVKKEGRANLNQGSVMLGPYKAHCHHVEGGAKPLKIYFDKIPYAGTAWHGTPSILDNNIQYVIECREGGRFGLCMMSLTKREVDVLGIQLTWMPGSKVVYFEIQDRMTWSSTEDGIQMQFYAAKDSDERMHLWVIGARNNHVALLGDTVATGETMWSQSGTTAPTITPATSKK